LFVIAVVVHIVVSLATGLPEAQKVADYTYKKAIYTAETIELKALPWFKNYRILSIILLIATTILVGFFW